MRNLELPGLRQYRKLMRMTLRDLAEATGVHISTISDIENGKRLARWHTAEQLAYGLNTTVLELAQGYDNRPSREEKMRMFEEADEMVQRAMLFDDSNLRFLYHGIAEEMQRRGLYAAPIKYEDVIPKEPSIVSSNGG